MNSQFTLFLTNANKFFDIIFNPIKYLQEVSYSVCLIGCLVAITLGVVGFDTYKYAWLCIIIFIFINIL
ncbi:MAG: hypothetical protein K0R54_2279 [Clostridiaceae bacterium]|jgi:hypothetical protein|nr:hypothetical protein [Clostridiaceae bacterium]